MSGILLTKTTAAQNGVALSYRKVCGLYFLAVVFVRRIVKLLLLRLSRVHVLYKARERGQQVLKGHFWCFWCKIEAKIVFLYFIYISDQPFLIARHEWTTILTYQSTETGCQFEDLIYVPPSPVKICKPKPFTHPSLDEKDIRVNVSFNLRICKNVVAKNAS